MIININGKKTPVNRLEEVSELTIDNYLKQNPDNWLFDGNNRFLCSILGKVCEITTSGDVKEFKLSITPEDLCFCKKWCVIKPVSCIDALSSLDCGSTVMRKTNDLNKPTIYTNDGTRNRDDYMFDLDHILNGQWFIIVKK